MTQHQGTDDVALPPCSAGHRARHMHDFRCLRAGGGHFVECACVQTKRYLDFADALSEWKRMHTKRGRPRKAKSVQMEASSVLQFPLLLQGTAR